MAIGGGYLFAVPAQGLSVGGGVLAIGGGYLFAVPAQGLSVGGGVLAIGGGYLFAVPAQGLSVGGGVLAIGGGYLFAVPAQGLGDAELLRASCRGAAGALVAGMALLKGRLGPEGGVPAGRGGGGGEDQLLQGSHLRLQHVDLETTPKNASSEVELFDSRTWKVDCPNLEFTLPTQGRTGLYDTEAMAWWFPSLFLEIYCPVGFHSNLLLIIRSTTRSLAVG